MAISRIILTWALLISAIISNVVGQSPMPSPAGAPGPVAPATDCTTLVYNMTDCLTYVTKGSKTSKPDKACCPELSGMLDSNPICLCQLLGKNKDLPIDLDFNRALKLPSVCGLQTPPLSMCSMIGIPIGAPTGAPVGSPTSISVPPSSSLSPSGGISPEASGPSPSPGKGTSGASHAKFRLVHLVAGLAILLTSLTF